jgi:hypothetical protein
MLVVTPEEVVSGFLGGRYAEIDDRTADRADLFEHAVGGAIFAAGVGALKHHEDAEAPICVEDILQVAEPAPQFPAVLFTGRFVQATSIARVIDGEIDAREWRRRDWLLHGELFAEGA